MKAASEHLSRIRNHHSIHETLGTAGQPDGGDFRLIRDAGFEVVINLALPTSDHALAEEGRIVTSLGMTYIHLPVDFATPSASDFDAFCGIMRAFQGRPVFVHCAANKRVSVFVFLYRVRFDHVPIPEAQQDLRAVWEPDEVWHRFIAEQMPH